MSPHSLFSRRVLCHLCHTWHVVGGMKVQNPQPAVASHAVQQSGAVFSSVSDKSCPAKFVFAKVLHDSETTAAGTSTNIARAIDAMANETFKRTGKEMVESITGERRGRKNKLRELCRKSV